MHQASSHGLSEQAALNRVEGGRPGNSQSSQPVQTASDASNSDGTAGPQKIKPKKKKQQLQPVAQLLEDQGLNAELDAANTGGLVETERDRLIRIVSTSAETTCQGFVEFQHQHLALKFCTL